MARLDNPAGRLHEFLRRYREVAGNDKTILATWAEVLMVTDEGEALTLLTHVAAQVPQIEEAINRLGGEEEHRNLLNHYAWAWLQPVFFPEHVARQTPSPGKALVDSGAMHSLGFLALHLSRVASEGAVPPRNEVEDLRGDLQLLAESVRTDLDLPPLLRSVILNRLNDIAWAVDHVEFGGPGAVKAAVERLAGSIAITHEAKAEGPVRNFVNERVSPVMEKAYGLFSAGPKTQASIEAWSNIAGMLP